ncbi:MAG: Asp-tRNA(Asn)/Glu-tRNA(Gln) amidotransferase subunit GatB [Dethiobacter sp.]|jgi:aspartyl-tRNA(Asn)/glutamyl-tRNA(Gln) amidotransferase subunit B|nr:Asp-tRNA(Asn)/Glu-tRNA(Gln) amidotransferase subunit GatB [Dethiobacter sp.]MBS3901442.1 Asp-tRNA(Asn)/Glu-tRNA(Gln) amidotransferase subunit GatB [Dethiobacter sp.]MBS3988436.1 Asp-tRNA(Asn)/Glu-tRNA(Gln) amidotransferase subunit GatB [Dethiobacter sp.]
MSKYETVIGLEVHVELATATKIFCSCPTEFGKEPNTHVCPVCLGLPGSLPVLNKRVVEFAIKAGLALNCQIPRFAKFDRKNYFYPDLPKAYQISQYDLPLAISGYLEFEVNGETKRVGITRVHLEEDAGKLVHAEFADYSLADYNRTGVPLIEIVSEPDLRSPEEAKAYLEKLKSVIQYTGISDVKMEEGSLRCDANVSIMPAGSKEFGTRSEIKNMNSFKAVQRGLAYEVERQKEVLEAGGKVVQETRRWDEHKGVTYAMRSKEEAHDYRYFPDPDLVPVMVEPAWVEEIRQSLPEMPDARRKRYQSEWGLPEYDAAVITASKAMADFFEATLAEYHDAKAVANSLLGEILKYLNAQGIEIHQTKLTPAHLAELLMLQADGTISGKIAKTVFEEMFSSGKKAAEIVQEQGLVQISDKDAIAAIIAQVIADNPKSVQDFKAGTEKALGFLVGQVMKISKGRANPEMANQLLREKLQ